MQNQTFGVEIEMHGFQQEKGAKLLQDFFNAKYGIQNQVRYIGDHCGNYQAYDNEGRAWNVMSDGSLDYNSCEMTTPILTYKDIELLQEVVRMYRENGAISTLNMDVECISISVSSLLMERMTTRQNLLEIY